VTEGRRILLACIGECEDNPVFWLRDAYGVDGTLYRIYHRRGRISVTRFGRADDEESELLIDREQGDEYDSAGSDESVLASIADLFELNQDGEPCLCGAVYPAAVVPMRCYRCGGFLRFPYAVSLETAAEIPVPRVAREPGAMRLALEHLTDEQAGRALRILDEAPRDLVCKLTTELDDRFWIVGAGGLLLLVAAVAGGSDAHELVDCLSSDGFTDDVSALSYAFAMFSEYLDVDFSQVECDACHRYRASPDAACLGCPGADA
jgi:hypothetical protein